MSGEPGAEGLHRNERAQQELALRRLAEGLEAFDGNPLLDALKLGDLTTDRRTLLGGFVGGVGLGVLPSFSDRSPKSSDARRVTVEMKTVAADAERLAESAYNKSGVKISPESEAPLRVDPRFESFFRDTLRRTDDPNKQYRILSKWVESNKIGFDSEAESEGRQHSDTGDKVVTLAVLAITGNIMRREAIGITDLATIIGLVAADLQANPHKRAEASHSINDLQGAILKIGGVSAIMSKLIRLRPKGVDPRQIAAELHELDPDRHRLIAAEIQREAESMTPMQALAVVVGASSILGPTLSSYAVSGILQPLIHKITVDKDGNANANAVNVFNFWLINNHSAIVGFPPGNSFGAGIGPRSAVLNHYSSRELADLDRHNLPLMFLSQAAFVREMIRAIGGKQGLGFRDFIRELRSAPVLKASLNLLGGLQNLARGVKGTRPDIGVAPREIGYTSLALTHDLPQEFAGIIIETINAVKSAGERDGIKRLVSALGKLDTFPGEVLGETLGPEIRDIVLMLIIQGAGVPQGSRVMGDLNFGIEWLARKAKITGLPVEIAKATVPEYGSAVEDNYVAADQAVIAIEKDLLQAVGQGPNSPEGSMFYTQDGQLDITAVRRSRGLRANLGYVASHIGGALLSSASSAGMLAHGLEAHPIAHSARFFGKRSLQNLIFLTVTALMSRNFELSSPEDEKLIELARSRGNR